MTGEKKIAKIGYPKIYSIHSQKGGVGKTSTALAIAGFEALFGDKKVLFIDADLTGTSIEHILETGYTENKKPYINKLLLANPEDFGKYTDIIPRKNADVIFSDHYCRNVTDFNIDYIPSSPGYSDIRKIVPLVSQESYLHFYRHRLEDIIVTALNQGFEAIVIDLPPGFFGLSKNICDMTIEQIIYNRNIKNKKNDNETRLDFLFNSKKSNIHAHGVFVSSGDAPDYKALLPIFCNYLQSVEKLESNDLKGNIDFIFNKLRGSGIHRPDPVIEMNMIFEELKEDAKKRKSEVPNYEKIIQLIETKHEEKGAIIFPNEPDFDIRKIISTIKRIRGKWEKIRELDKLEKQKKINELKKGVMNEWCFNIGNFFNIIEG